jgi:tRNA threonylcarbamoyladenosine modification (KEOPS) complex Cgi121 subunit
MKNEVIFEYAKINPAASKEEISYFNGFQSTIGQFDLKIEKDLKSVTTNQPVFNKILSDIQQISKKNEVSIQLFDANMIFCEKQIYHAIYFAEKAFLLKKNISHGHAIEYLLYTSLQRQIKNALNLVGFKGIMNQGTISYLIAITGRNLTEKKNLFTQINQMISNHLGSTQFHTKSSEFNVTKLESLMPQYQIKPYELLNALHLRNVSTNDLKIIESEKLRESILDCLVEKMVALSLENN